MRAFWRGIQILGYLQAESLQIRRQIIHRSIRPEVFCKKGVLKNFTKFTAKHLGQSLFFFYICRPQACNFIKKETLAQVFSWEFCQTFKNTFVIEDLWCPLLPSQMFLKYSSRISIEREILFRFKEAVVQSCSVKTVFLKISQKSQENTCSRVSFSLRPATLLKRDSGAGVF